MTVDIVRNKLLAILEHAPKLKDIMLASTDLEEKRKRIRGFLAENLAQTFEDTPTIPPLEWILTRESIQVFRSIVSSRSERLAGFSFLEFLDGWLNRTDSGTREIPTPGFIAEFEHLVKGISGKTELYRREKLPSFSKYHGKKASRLRSNDLSRMARRNRKFRDRYPSGLSDDSVRRRSINKTRVLQRFGATDLEWGKWTWHMRNIIRDEETLSGLVHLTDHERLAIRAARKHKIPFGITPYYVSLFDHEPHRLRDDAIRSQVLPSLHYVNTLQAMQASSQTSMDFMMERYTTPIDGVTRRYPNIVILKPVLTCPQICVYCQRNWEIEDVHSAHAILPKEKLDQALLWIRETPEIEEVLITGGDPFLLSNKKIEHILYRLSEIPHVVRIRFGSRTPVTLPQRITDSLIRTIKRYQIPGKREIIIITHFEHQYEITPESKEAIQKFRREGLEVYNQLVYTFYNSRRFEACDLRQQLRLIGVTPYYTFNTKGKTETNDFRVPISRLLQEQDEEARLMPGSVRTDKIVFNVPRLGKNYLNSKQHHDVISILPDGSRMYEFHPWEKKLSLVDTYIYQDVSIYEYLQRLKKVGEKKSDYESIWYYY